MERWLPRDEEMTSKSFGAGSCTWADGGASTTTTVRRKMSSVPTSARSTDW
jgi:hypothetical protein